MRGLRSRKSGRLGAVLLAVLMAVTLAPGAGAQSEKSEDLASIGNGKNAGWEDASQVAFEPTQFAGSMYWTARELTGAAEYWNTGYTGEGVDIAIIDTGVSTVAGLDAPGKLIYGADLSFESQDPDLTHVDNNGHGTHLAGIMAGRDSDVKKIQKSDEGDFLGMAPDARVLSVKVGSREGTVDVSQVIAAIQWVVDHRHDNGMNVRVLNLAFGTDSLQPWELDPLAYAVERAWDAGIVVVVASGNDGTGSPLRNPAINPHVIAVGASIGNDTADASDDELASFSSCGGLERHVDVLAPGKSLVSLRSPGSYADDNFPEARVGDRFFLGSGTSQSAAVVSGAAALILDQRPSISPDQVKALLMNTAQPLKSASAECQGAGLIDLKTALDTATPAEVQSHPSASGIGSLEGSRGNAHVALDGVVLKGEQDIFGTPWSPCGPYGSSEIEWEFDGNEYDWEVDGPSCKIAAASHWEMGDWNSVTWSGVTWSGVTWSGVTWSGVTWSGVTWSGVTWSGVTWSGVTWSGNAWN